MRKLDWSAIAMGVVVRRVRASDFLMFARGAEKGFGFRIGRRDPDVARAELGASVCRMTDKPGDRPHQNYAALCLTWD
jgi:hypothetical protein